MGKKITVEFRLSARRRSRSVMNFLCPAYAHCPMNVTLLADHVVDGEEAVSGELGPFANIPTSAKKKSTEKRKFGLRPRARRRWPGREPLLGRGEEEEEEAAE
ncbi:hypothetical protein C4D60_Mb05t27170 [Musa balbisiana]|uniref:Uncharacterized protein n=1 Tax=Musa balbisiana TaxID=52838 RepID=A0A4S8JZ99_MUSBA|nr:hypothetical protein C4D60_Mb05t27170 [Musa balbisiana]